MYKMKKLTALFAFLFLTAFCFANGKLEEKKRIETFFLSNPNVEKIVMKTEDLFEPYDWMIDIYLKNDGYIHIENCEEKNFFNDSYQIEQIGNYKVWIQGIKKYNNSKWERCALEIVFSNILQLQINSILDIINNYQQVVSCLEKISKETIEERSRRYYQESTGPEFFSYYGNLETNLFYVKLFSMNEDDFHTGKIWIKKEDLGLE